MLGHSETTEVKEKQKKVEELFGKRVPRYLFFVLEHVSHLTTEEKTMIEQLFGVTHSFLCKPQEPNEKGLGSSLDLNTLPEELSTVRVVHIRDGTRMCYSFQLRGHICHLIQAGDDKHTITFMEWSKSKK